VSGAVHECSPDRMSGHSQQHHPTPLHRLSRGWCAHRRPNSLNSSAMPDVRRRERRKERNGVKDESRTVIGEIDTLVSQIIGGRSSLRALQAPLCLASARRAPDPRCGSRVAAFRQTRAPLSAWIEAHVRELIALDEPSPADEGSIRSTRGQRCSHCDHRISCFTTDTRYPMCQTSNPWIPMSRRRPLLRTVAPDQAT
jgi:hypothetical protein